MEVRGFAASPRAGEDRAPGEPLVAAHSVALHREGKPVLAGVDVDVRPGDVVLLAGATGSGKSTLLRALDGSAPHLGEVAVAGELRVTGVDRLATPPRDTADLVGAVAQDVRAGFVAATVAEEVGFAWAVRGDSVAEMRDRVAAVAAELDIVHLLDRDIHALSAGEASRVALAAALVGDPRLVLLDEPLADLDAESRDLVLTALRSRAARGVAVVVAEHREDAVEGLASRRWVIDGGRLEESARRLAPEGPLPRAAEDSGAPVVARVRGLSAGYGGEPVLRDIDLEIRRGEVVAIAGANGAGKSTLLDGIARTGRRGVVVVGGADVAALRPRARRLRVALVPERPDDLFVRASVAEECVGADRVLGGRGRVVRGATLHLASELAAIPSADFEALLARHPRDLSAGQRLCLALAIQATAHPDLLLVDEPVRGLDADARRLVAAALARLATRGTAVVVATHDTAFADGIAHRALLLADGALAPLRSLA
jgi:energy-coupling factor transport system ATP-binding protein